ncbi:MAG: sugar phosphate isomerase/epimerase family protein [Armatimonadota bacterium]
MKIEQVAAQLYTARDHLQTPSDIASTLKKIREMGYEAVQVSGLGPIDDDELAKILNGEGLICCATHEAPDKIINEPQAVIEKLNRLECKYTAYPHPSGVKLDTLDDVKALAARLNASGKVLYDNGKALTYHNHAIEFRRFEDRLMLDVLYGETDPRYLGGEIDTYWVQYGGGDPIAWCRQLKNRLPLLHMKDYGVNTSGQPIMTEIGCGNMNWREIITAAEESGCEWFMVEQDICEVDSLQSLKISFDYISQHLVE